MRSKKKAVIVFESVLLVLMWGTFSAVSKLVLAELDSFTVLFYMFAAAFISMSAYMLTKGRFRKFSAVKGIKLAGAIVLALLSFLYYFLYTLALKKIPATEAAALNYFFPFAIVLLAAPVNGEKISGKTALSMLPGMAGLILVITNGNISGFRMTDLSGDLLALGAAFSWAFFSVLSKKFRLPLLESVYIIVTSSFIFSAISAVIFSDLQVPGPGQLPGLIWLGVINIAVCYLLWLRIVAAAPAAMAASLSLATPFVTLLFIAVLLNEKITVWHIFGFILIVSGVYINTRVRRNN